MTKKPLADGLLPVLRYHLAGDVPWRHLPLFIFNKAVSLAATIFVACSYLVGKVIRWHNPAAQMSQESCCDSQLSKRRPGIFSKSTVFAVSNVALSQIMAAWAQIPADVQESLLASVRTANNAAAV